MAREYNFDTQSQTQSQTQTRTQTIVLSTVFFVYLKFHTRLTKAIWKVQSRVGLCTFRMAFCAAKI